MTIAPIRALLLRYERLTPIILAGIGLILRLVNLSTPKGLVFDELYYVDGARDFLAHGVEVTGAGPEFIAHPPLGKWLIAGGIKIFGNHEFGWRFATALTGSFLIYLIARVAQKLFQSPILTAIAGILALCDGLALVHSRTALLDLFLTFFVLAGAYSWLLDRHIVTAIFFGLACSVKWSGIYFLIFFLLWTLWREYQMGAGLLSIIVRKIQYLSIAFLYYCATWSGWFISGRGWDRSWASNKDSAFSFVPKVIRNFWHYHSEILNFHTGLTTSHPYSANVWSWLIQGRPTSFFYAAPHNCGTNSCAQEVLALGTPLLWWLGTIALCVVFGFWVKAKREKANAVIPGFILSGFVCGYLPWFFFQKRTVFSFYAIVFEPFLIFALVYCAKLILESNWKWRREFIAVVVVAIALNFAYLYPIFVGQSIPYSAWHARMWLPSWI